MITGSIAFLIFLFSSQATNIGYSQDFFGMVIGGDIFMSTELVGGYINEGPMARFLDEEIASGGVVKAYDFVSAKFDTFHPNKDQTLRDLSNFNEYTINLFSVSETALEATNQRYYEPTELYGDKLSASSDVDIF